MKKRWTILFLALWGTQGLTSVDVTANCLSDQAGNFAYYKLALTRSPEWCIVNHRPRDAQCRYEFVMHGLWPHCERGFPERCRVADYSLLDDIDENALLNIYPSRVLLRQQWERHGSCSGLARSAYFSLSIRLYQSIQMPEIAPGQYTERQLLDLIAKENRGFISEEMIELVCDADAAAPLSLPNTLDEVRVCFDRQGSPMACLERIKSCPDNGIEVRAIGH